MSDRMSQPRIVLLALTLGACGESPPEPMPPVPPACATGDVLVSSRFSNNVLRFSGTDGTSLGVFADGGGMDNPNGIVFGHDRNLYVGLGDAGSVLRYDGNTGDFVDVFVASGTNGLASPRGVTLSTNGNLLVANGSSDEVLEFEMGTGAFVQAFGPHPDLDGPVGVAVASDGTLYVSSGINGGVFLFDVHTGGFLSRIAANFPNTTGLAVASNDEVWVASSTRDEVRRYDPVTDNLLGNAAAGGGLTIPIGLWPLGDGSLLVASFETDNIKQFDPASGGFIGDFVMTRAGGLDGTHFFATVPAGNLHQTPGCVSP